MSRFLSNVYNIRVRVVSDIQTLAFGSSLYIRYNTAAHVVNITYKTLYLAQYEHIDNFEQGAIIRVLTYRRYANITVWYFFVFSHVPRRYAELLLSAYLLFAGTT